MHLEAPRGRCCTRLSPDVSKRAVGKLLVVRLLRSQVSNECLQSGFEVRPSALWHRQQQRIKRSTDACIVRCYLVQLTIFLGSSCTHSSSAPGCFNITGPTKSYGTGTRVECQPKRARDRRALTLLTQRRPCTLIQGWRLRKATAIAKIFTVGYKVFIWQTWWRKFVPI